MDGSSIDESSGRSRMPPPLPCLIGLLLGLLWGWFTPWHIGPYHYVLPVGLALVAAVVYLSIAMSAAFERHGTSPDPAVETRAIVDTGPFRYTRNPAYIAAAVLQIALGFLFNNAWVLLLTIPALLAIHYVVVLREEVYLQSRFGKEYLRYKARVRRWL